MELRSWEEMEEMIGGSWSSRYIYNVLYINMVKTAQHFKMLSVVITLFVGVVVFTYWLHIALQEMFINS